MNHRNHLRSSFYHQKWASITLRSPMQSPFDHPSINFDHPSSITPRPPTMIEAPSRAFSPRLPPRCAGATQRRNPHDGPDNQTTVDKQHDRSPARLTCGRGCNWGRLDSPHHPHESVANRNRQIINASTAEQLSGKRQIKSTRPPDLAERVRRSFAEIGRTKTVGSARTHQRTRQRLCGPYSNATAATDPADTVQTRHPATCVKAWNAAISAPRPHDRKSHAGRSKGIYARVANQAFHSVEAVEACEPEQQPGQRRNLRFGEMPEIGRQTTRRGGGVGGKNREPAIIDLSSPFRAALFQNLGGPSLKNLGRPEKPSALTQGSHRIRQIELAAIRVVPGANPHQRAFVSHGEAYCHD
jgi:hypothetical protein